MSMILGNVKIFVMYNIPTTILILVTLTVTVSMAVLIISARSELLPRFRPLIDSIPFLAGLIPVTGFLTEIHSISRAISSIHASGMGDPRVVAAGFQELFFNMTVSGGLFFIFLEAGLIVRMLYDSYLRELDMPPK
jgi:hypothetical protein